MIDTLSFELKYNWQDHVNALVQAYNCMDITDTNFSPHYLMFGREPNLSIDIEFGVRTPDLVATSTKELCGKTSKEIGMGLQKSSGSKPQRE